MDLPWGWKFPEIPSRGFLFAFIGILEFISFSANSDLRWNFPAGTSELIPFGDSSDLPWDLGFLEIPSRGFHFDFPCWGLLCLSVRGELNISPLVVLLCFSFIEELNQSAKYNIYYVPLDPVPDDVFIADLNTKLRVGRKRYLT